jgi:hypothetical protein
MQGARPLGYREAKVRAVRARTVSGWALAGGLALIVLGGLLLGSVSVAPGGLAHLLGSGLLSGGVGVAVGGLAHLLGNGLLADGSGVAVGGLLGLWLIRKAPLAAVHFAGMSTLGEVARAVASARGVESRPC